ncbi:hypothetical protein [Microbacterium esteraromaticum]|uniref:hypothetical protein n=1 Tax=Microbacterium esteraromaticum TaxID=57043 RepID=UPI0015F6870B|nr:hypothetical protein [Microbacterium esteraromaticum]
MGEDNEADAAKRAASEARAAAWARKMADRIPTGWIITGAGAVLLGATAAFGGLEPASEPVPKELEAGEHFVGSDLDIAVLGAEVGGEVRGAGVVPDEGEETLIVTLEVTNLFEEPRIALAPHTLSAVRIDGVEIVRSDAKRIDDGSVLSYLQPDVRTRVRLAWTIDEDAVSPGDEIRIILPDSTRYEGSFVTRGSYWADIQTGAYVTVPVDAVPADEEVVEP